MTNIEQNQFTNEGQVQTQGTSQQPQHKYNKGIMICCAIFMIIPIFNIIFGAIGMKVYPKKTPECKSYRAVSIAAFVIGIIELIIVAIILGIVYAAQKGGKKATKNII